MQLRTQFYGYIMQNLVSQKEVMYINIKCSFHSVHKQQKEYKKFDQ